MKFNKETPILMLRIERDVKSINASLTEIIGEILWGKEEI